MSVKFNASTAYSTAKSFTEKAIENGLFLTREDPKESAQEIMEFFHFIVDSTTSGENSK